MITLSKIFHKDQFRILIRFPNDQEIRRKICHLEGIRYSSTHRGWHIPYDKSSWKAFGELGLAYHIVLRAPEEPVTTTSNSTEQEIHTNATTSLTGTASPSPEPSDNAGITSDHKTAVNSLLPPVGEAGEGDIRLEKGGREVMYSAGKFVLKIHFNERDVAFLKGIRGWWNSSVRRWVVKGTLENLEKLQQQFAFWDDTLYNRIEDIILTVTKPYAVTLYSVPECKDHVMVQVCGHRANLDIIQRISARAYQKENQRWKIPRDPVLIDRILEEYHKDGATIINRLPLLGEDYHRHRPSYGQWKRHWLEKTDTDLRGIVEPYLDALSTRRYSLRTFDSYLGPFVRFVRHIGIERLDQVMSQDIRQYMSMLGARKISDTYLHSAINAIKFYYRHVRYNDRLVIEEIKRPKKGKPLPTILSVNEIDRLLQATDNLKHATLLYTLYSSGMRLNEILNLRTEDLWWDRNQIMIRRGKGKKDRIVPLSGILKRMLELYFHEYKPIYWLFEGQDRKYQYSEKSVQNVVKRAAQRAGINKRVTPHTIRHCYATHLLDGGTDVRFIQELLGHANITTTLIYTHVTNYSMARIESPLDKLMNHRADGRFLTDKFEKSES